MVRLAPVDLPEVITDGTIDIDQAVDSAAMVYQQIPDQPGAVSVPGPDDSSIPLPQTGQGGSGGGAGGSGGGGVGGGAEAMGAARAALGRPRRRPEAAGSGLAYRATLPPPAR